MQPLAAVVVLVLVVVLQQSPVGGGSSVSIPATDWENVWTSWWSRIVLTILAVAAWEYWQRQRQQRPIQRPGQLPPQQLGTKKKATTTTLSSHPLLDRLEQRRGGELAPAETESVAATSIPIQQHDDSSISQEDKDTSQVVTPALSQGKSSSVATRVSKKTTTVAPPRPIPTPTSTAPPPPISNTINRHPGMKEFAHWYEVETSLYRIYTLGRHDGVQVVPPYIPHSYRGQVSLHLRVTNKTNTTLSVYWVDYKGKHVHKGIIKPNQLWTQTTWIDHPWVFEGPDHQDNPTPYLYYIPYRIIPTLPDCPTVDPDDPTIGICQFSILPIAAHHYSTSPHYVQVQDHVFPHPAELHFTTPSEAIAWTLHHMSRLSWSWNDPTMDLLQKYLKNIMDSPETANYRQLRLRSSTKNKFGTIWNSPLQGLLLAVGFVPVQAYAELGCANRPLPKEWIQELRILSHQLQEWQDKERQQLSSWLQQEQQDGGDFRRGLQQQQQPEGADGFGRAGFGRAGAMR